MIWDQEFDYYKNFQAQNNQMATFKRKSTNSTQGQPKPQIIQTEIRSCSQELYTQVLIEEFELSTFKVQINIFKQKSVQCPNKENHNRKHCLYYHGENDRRRNPDQYIYSCDFCAYGKNCAQSNPCQYSHNKVEQLYHFNRYKTKYCQSKGVCEYGKYCSFAHSDDQIQIPQILHKMPQDKLFWIYAYKTVWCPYIETHDRGTCVYAHNAQDFRRDPRVFNYEPNDCEQWSKSNTVTSYKQGGCQLMEHCKYCHGWKENEYHPHNYKTKRCSNGINCKKKERECAYYHNEQEKRVKNDKDESLGEEQNKYQQKFVKDIFNELVSAKKMPVKTQSNFNGPIIPKNTLNEKLDKKLFRQKLEIGQPFEVFSSTVTGISSTESRKMSDISYQDQVDQASVYQKSDVQLLQTRKKPNSAPATPDQQTIPKKNYDMYQLAAIMQNIQQQQYSERFVKQMLKKPTGSQMTGALQQNNIDESILMASSEAQLRKILNFLAPHQIQIVITVIQELKIEANDDNFLLKIMDQDQSINSIKSRFS